MAWIVYTARTTSTASTASNVCVAHAAIVTSSYLLWCVLMIISARLQHAAFDLAKYLGYVAIITVNNHLTHWSYISAAVDVNAEVAGFPTDRVRRECLQTASPDIVLGRWLLDLALIIVDGWPTERGLFINAQVEEINVVG